MYKISFKIVNLNNFLITKSSRYSVINLLKVLDFQNFLDYSLLIMVE